MDTSAPRRSPSRRRSYDALTGFRIGAMVGALLGVVISLLLGSSLGWWIVSTGAAGGALGYRAVSHKQQGDASDSETLHGRRR